MRKDTLLTRKKIIATAEKLFADRGVDAVSLNEITREAGQKNKSALNYHFGSKETLLRAIIEKHESAVMAQRNSYLDDLELRKAVNVENVVRAFVYPLAAKLDDPDGGKCYLSILAQLSAGPGMSLYRLRPDYIQKEERVMKLLRNLTPDTPKELYTPRLMHASSLLFHGLAYLASVMKQNREDSRRLCQVFTENLVDAIVAVIETPPSQAMQRTLAEAS